MKSSFYIGLISLLCCSAARADFVTHWDIGEQVADFTAQYIDPTTGNAESITWYQESGSDVYVISTCAMWCGPCQQFAFDSDSLVQSLAADGIQAEVYDFLFEDFNFGEPDSVDAQLWIDNAWSSDPENVWFGGEISTMAPDSVTIDIFEAIWNEKGQGSGAVGLPAIAILDRNFVVRHLMEGYLPSRIDSAARNAAMVPEPASAWALFLATVWMFRRQSRPRGFSRHSV